MIPQKARVEFAPWTAHDRMVAHRPPLVARRSVTTGTVQPRTAPGARRVRSSRSRNRDDVPVGVGLEQEHRDVSIRPEAGTDPNYIPCSRGRHARTPIRSGRRPVCRSDRPRSSTGVRRRCPPGDRAHRAPRGRRPHRRRPPRQPVRRHARRTTARRARAPRRSSDR